MTRYFGKLATTMNFVAGVIIVVLMLATTADVANRALRGQSFAGLAEYFEVLLVAFLYLSLTHTQRKGSHVQIDSVVSYLPRTWRPWVEAFGCAVVIAVLAVFVWYSADRAWESLLQREFRMGLTRVPVWPARLMIPLGYAALMIQFGLEFAERVRIARGGEAEPSTEVGEAATP